MKEFFAAKGPRLMLDETSVFDIGSCIVDGIDLAPGRAIPDDGDPRIDHSLEGFLFTCGPDHIRPGEPMDGDPDRRYPLHGSFSAHPARILSFVNGDAVSEAVAEVPVIMATGQPALLTRTIRIEAATETVSITDRVTNTGPTAFAPMLMYHMNLGAKWLDGKTNLKGPLLQGGGGSWQFGDGEMTVECVPAAPTATDGWATVRLGPIAAIGRKSLQLSFSVDTLPYLQMWRNSIAPAHILGLEPASHAWKKRPELHADGSMVDLKPGETKIYRVTFAFVQ